MTGPLIGNERINGSVLCAIKENRLPHAVIIEGEKGTGRHTLAGFLTRAFLCFGEEKPCGACESCRLAGAGSHPDIYIAAPEDGKKNITVAQIRSLRNEAYVKPHIANGRAFIIDMADTMNEQSQNALLKVLEDITENADNKAVTEQQKVTRERMAKLPLANLKADAFGDGKTKEFFDRPEWKELSESCLGCGTCTFVCPTCQCYDIKDFNTGHGVKRFRCWDSCMYSEFTKMSAGQPRLTQLERFRQRFMHKLVYFPTNNDGMFSCVGCGRCLAKCPIQMNIVKVMKKLGGNANG